MHCKWCARTRMCALKWCAVHSYHTSTRIHCTVHQDACTVSGVSYTHTSTRIHCTVSGVPAPGCMHCERCVVHSYQHQDTLYQLHCTVSGVPAPGCMHCERCVVHSYQHQDTLYCKWCASTRMHALWAVCRTLIPAPGYMYCLCMHDKGIVKDKCQFYHILLSDVLLQVRYKYPLHVL